MSAKNPNKRSGFAAAAGFAIAVVLCLVLALTLSSCITIKLNSTKGSGNVITRDFEVQDFTRLYFSGIGKLIVQQGETEALSVEAEENVMDNIRVDVSGNMLEIGFRGGVFHTIPTRDIVFHLTVKELESITISGAGNLECDSLEVQSLEINSSGAGNIELGITADNLEIGISGAGKVDLSGSVNTQALDISGAGSYNARDLESNQCEIDISGAGRAVVRVNEVLDIRISGLGSVEYYGSPSVTQNVSGVGGSVKKLD